MKNPTLTLALLFMLLSGCNPEFLDKKPDKALVVPSELNHFQALLDGTLNGMNVGPSMQDVSGDEFYHPDANLKNLSALDRNVYLWESDVYEGKAANDWDVPYRCIFYANVVLDGLNKIEPDQAGRPQWESIYGSALFFRAIALHGLAQVFAAPFDQSTAADLPGLPVRLTSDINEIVGRGTLLQTYDQIISDLTQAEKMVPVRTTSTNRPSLPAVKALLARVYLTMKAYEPAGKKAEECLDLYSALLDYNTLNPAAARPFPLIYTGKNPEVIFQYFQTGATLPILSLTGVDSLLYNLYQPTDLRKTCFFTTRPNGVKGYKGSYHGGSGFFSGLATDEVYLIRSECYARSGQTALALRDLNTLLLKRFVTGSFKPLIANDQQVLGLVLTERRKELFGRSTRWSDLRRLNTDPGYAVTLKRIKDGNVRKLLPGDNRYTFPIPDNEVQLGGICQNPR